MRFFSSFALEHFDGLGAVDLRTNLLALGEWYRADAVRTGAAAPCLDPPSPGAGGTPSRLWSK